jgi:oxygen-independent coproporphyrinogen-3 oxidase
MHEQITEKMAGIYIHIPFCKQACHYCDFHFSTSLSNKKELVNSILLEIELQKQYLDNEPIETIYFGGGTPSLLTEHELGLILNMIAKYNTISLNPEITMEANPDDINLKSLKSFKSLDINRLSIGIQTFYDQHLRWMNRAHSSLEAQQSVVLAKEADFNNLTIDLIYGIPFEDHSIWENDLEQAIKLDVNHISAYNLTIEDKTVFGKWKKTDKLTEVSDEFAATQFEMLIDTLSSNGLVQYEISNFARENAYSRHNSSYWKRAKYLGLGPSAHSYNGISRQSNISNNGKYINALFEGKLPFTLEVLSEKDKANDHLITSLRTIWGADLNYLSQFTSLDFSEFQKTSNQYISSGKLVKINDMLILTQSGKFIADRIIGDLFF